MGVHILCSVTVEELSYRNGPVRRTINLVKARISLVKSDGGGLLIRITPMESKGVRKSLGYRVSEPILHKNFLNQGKATIIFNENPVNIMIKNSPPDALRLFLGNLRVQWKELLSKPQRRNRLPVDVPNTSLSLLDELSPMRIVAPTKCSSVPPSDPIAMLDLSPVGKKSKCVFSCMWFIEQISHYIALFRKTTVRRV